MIGRAQALIESGGVIAAPTDTLVGLLALASDSAAASRVIAIKGGGRTAPLPVLVADLEAASEVGLEMGDLALGLARRFWPGAVTLVVRARPGCLAPEVTAGGDTVGLRVPGPSPAAELLGRLRVPLTGTSANLSSQAPSASSAGLDPRVAAAVDLVLDGPAGSGEASAVIEVTGPRPRLLRGDASLLSGWR